MDEINIIEITLAHYEYLIRSAERIAVIERLMASGEYLTSNAFKAILDIEEREGSNG